MKQSSLFLYLITAITFFSSCVTSANFLAQLLQLPTPSTAKYGYSSYEQDGFTAGTLVKTSYGYRYIAELTAIDLVSNQHENEKQVIGVTTKLWWSKDYSGHGGSFYKVFKECAKGFEWVFDAAKDGVKIIGKHKGPVGLFIPYSEVIFL